MDSDVFKNFSKVFKIFKFVGLIIEPYKKCPVYVKMDLHVTQAVLKKEFIESLTSSAEVGCNHEGVKYIICRLDKTNFQCPLNLRFKKGENLVFSSEGDDTVHLTGYYTGNNS
jgi:Nucleoplasmin-like domain